MFCVQHNDGRSSGGEVLPKFYKAHLKGHGICWIRCSQPSTLLFEGVARVEQGCPKAASNISRAIGEAGQAWLGELAVHQTLTQREWCILR